MEIEICVPAINRPKLIEQMISSFCNHIKGIDFSKSTIYLNVDPVPIIYGREKVIEVCKKYVGNVIYNLPLKPHMSVAFKWLLKQTKDTSKYFFFINDDWLFVKDIHIKELIERIEKYNEIKQVAINTNWTHQGNNNPSDFRISKNNKYKTDQFDMFHGTPCLFDNKFIKKIINNLDEYDIGHGGGAEIIEPQMTDKYGKKSIWFDNNNIYYCEDLGIEWKKNYGIPPPMLYECQNYKLCIYCGNLEYKFKCNICKKNEASVVCSEKCFKKHCILVHKDNENPKMIEYKNSYYEKYYKHIKKT